MAIVAPFRGVTYNPHKIKHIGRVVTPPYDVISERDQDEYYKKDPYNVVRLILGKKKAGDSDWDNRYTRATDLLKRWESEEILVRSQCPCMYLTSIEYELPEKRETRTRLGFIAVVRIEEDGSSVILPHERTFTIHRVDRFKLMRACNTQFSPIFGLYGDEHNVIKNVFEEIKDSQPMFSFREQNEGCYYKMWQVTSNSAVKNIAAHMLSKSIVIADGHHRYETARNFRNLMRARHGVHGSERAYEYVMMYLANIADKGVTLLPSHRLVKSRPGFKIKQFLSSANKWFDVLSFPFSAKNQEGIKKTFLGQLQEQGHKRTVIGFYHLRHRSFYLLCLKSAARKELSDDLDPSLKKLDVSVLSDLIFRRLLGIQGRDLINEEMVQYESNTNTALSSVTSGHYQMVFLVNPTRIEQVLEVTGNSLLMPQKSTYFYPKIVTGLVFNKIDPSETIHLP